MDRCYIIAEAGVNHNGDLKLAKKLVEEAAKAGADAVKFQTFSAKRLASPKAVKARYQQQNDATVETQQAMLSRLELSAENHHILQTYCKQHNIHCLIVLANTSCKYTSTDVRSFCQWH